MKATTEQVIKVTQLNSPKHVKIWKLHLLELTKKEIALTLGTNYGHVYNVIKDYSNNVIKQSDVENMLK